MQLVIEGNYSSTANCRTKFLVVFQGIFGIFRGNVKLLFIYSIFFSRNSVRETSL